MKGRILKRILVLVALVGGCGVIAFFVSQSTPPSSENRSAESSKLKEKPSVKSPTSKTPRDFEDTTKLILSNRNQGNGKEAIRLGEEYLKSDPRNIVVLIMLVEDYLAGREFSLAVKRVKGALKITPDSSWGLRILSEIYWVQAQGTGDPQIRDRYLAQAKKQIDKALAVDSDDVWINADAARIYFALNEKGKAEPFIDKALKLDPKNINLQNIKTQIKTGL